ncbi:MAG: MipA/OmpV family protein [Pseudomonadota bacterium]
MTRQSSALKTWTVLAIAAAIAAPAIAQERGSSNLQFIRDLLVPDRTIVTAGVGPEFRPDYFGSDDYGVGVGTSFLVKFQSATFGEDGLSVNILPNTDFEFGPVARLAGGRDESANEALEGLGDVGRTLELGAFGAVTIAETYRLRARYRHAIATGHRGGLLDVQAGRVLFEGRRVSSAAGIGITWVDNDYADAFFSVTEGASLESGVLPVFNAGGGIRDVRLGWNGAYRLTDRWGLAGYLRYNYLVGDTADSPIVDLFGSRHQVALGMNLNYQFDFATGRRARNGS